MNEGWTTPRVATCFLLLLVLVMGWTLHGSLDHQQLQIVKLNDELKELRTTRVELNGLDTIVIKHEGLPQYVPMPSGQPGMPPSNGGAAVAPPSNGGASADVVRRSADGKDAIGRPLQETPGFTLYPPLGVDLPGYTSARTPEFIPELCGTFNNGEPSEPDKINYRLTNDGLANRVDRWVHERLFNINLDNPQEIVPELAVAWETGDDKLTYRFHLRKGVRFSDGSPFSADDVIFTYNVMMDPDVESDVHKAKFDMVESVHKIDDYTVEVRMRKKHWKALKNFGYNLRIIPKAYHEQAIPRRAAERDIRDWGVVPGEPGFAEVYNTFTRSLSPGTGPYRWKEGSWETNQYIVLYPNLDSWYRKLNPDHYRMEKMRWRIVGDQVARQQEYKNGRIDIISTDHNSWEDQLQHDPQIKAITKHFVYDHIALLYSYLGMNCRRFPFNDKSARRAIGHLMDRERILEELQRGHGTIATCFTKRMYKEYSPEIVPYDYNLEKAAKLLADDGWADTDGDGLLDKDGRTFEFNFSVPSSRTFFLTVTTMLQESCKKIGIRCKADPKEWSLFVTDLYERNFDMVCLYASAPDPWMDPYENYHSSQTGPRQGNHFGWVNAEADALLEAMREEFDDDKRAKMFHKLNYLFHEDLPMLLLVHGEVGVMLNKRCQGAKVRPTGMQPFDIWIDPKDVAE